MFKVKLEIVVEIITNIENTQPVIFSFCYTKNIISSKLPSDRLSLFGRSVNC
jgi:hypothetical protein